MDHKLVPIRRSKERERETVSNNFEMKMEITNMQIAGAPLWVQFASICDTEKAFNAQFNGILLKTTTITTEFRNDPHSDLPFSRTSFSISCLRLVPSPITPDNSN